MLSDCDQFYIAGTELDRLTDDDVLGDTAQFIDLVCHGSIEQVVDRHFERGTGEHALFLAGNTMTADLLDLAFHAHHVRDKHEMADIHEDTLLIERGFRFVDDRFSCCLDTEYLSDLADIVGAGTLFIHTGNTKYTF